MNVRPKVDEFPMITADILDASCVFQGAIVFVESYDHVCFELIFILNDNNCWFI